MQTIKSLPDLNNTKVLVVRIDKIGSILLATAFMHAFKKHYPHAQIDMLLAKNQAQVMKYSEDIDNLYTYDKKDWLGFVSTVLQLRKNTYDYIIVMSHLSKTASNIVRFIPAQKARICIAKIKPFFHSLYKYNVELPSNPIMQNYYEELAIRLGFTIESSKPLLPFNPEDAKHMDTQFPKINAKRIIFFIGNLDLKKDAHRWQAPKYAQLLLKTKKYFEDNKIDAEIILMAGLRDVPLFEDFKDIPKDMYKSYVGKSIHETAALLEKTDLLVCGSTGPAHMAAAVNCPVMSIVSPLDFKHWKPYGDTNFAVIAKENSVLNISVEDAYSVLEEFIKNWK